jgi:hypothetical protein
MQIKLQIKMTNLCTYVPITYGHCSHLMEIIIFLLFRIKKKTVFIYKLAKQNFNVSGEISIICIMLYLKVKCEP